MADPHTVLAVAFGEVAKVRQDIARINLQLQETQADVEAKIAAYKQLLSTGVVTRWAGDRLQLQMPDGTWTDGLSLSGPQGVRGAQGVPGLQGPDGPQGPTGLRGLIGIQGVPGVAAKHLIALGLTINSPVLGAPALSPNNATLRYAFDNAGTPGLDSAGSNAGILSGSPLPTIVAGKINTALSFTGGTGYVAFTDAATFSLAANGLISVTLWFKCAGAVATACLLSLRSTVNGQPIINIVLGFDGVAGTAGMPRALFRDDGGLMWSVSSGLVCNDNNWHHLAFTRASDGTLKLYVDGTQRDSVAGGTGAATFNTAGSAIGKDPLNGAITPLVGILDDFRIYKRTLPPTEVSALAAL
jgi:Concanavalin A-like lectin/glucanases superfamily/Collagen triple helix repeat (20 copies)